MFEQLSSGERVTAVQRLTALWALNECGLGGILHAMKSPFTGLVLGSIAMMCIAMICTISGNKWKALLSALFTVLIIKAMVSPHSSPTAYFAVTFQALSGALIYRYIPNLLFASMLFVTLGHIESAFQRLLTLTILYGNTLWKAIDQWGEWVSDKWKFVLPLQSSQMVILTYLAIHFVAGLFVGWVIYRIIKRTHTLWGQARYRLQLGAGDIRSFRIRPVKRRRFLKPLIFAGIFLLIIATYLLKTRDSGITDIVFTVIRVIGIVVLWFGVVAPLAMRIIKRYLDRRHGHLAEQVSGTLNMLPQIAWILDKAWKESKHLPWPARWKTFALTSLLYTLQYQTTDDTHTDRTHAEP